VNILSQEFELKGNEITLYLTNPIQVDILNDFRSELMDHLREKLNNDFIKLNTQVMEQDDKKMIYTNKEKFKHLADKNKQLKLLQERLGLDPDL